VHLVGFIIRMIFFILVSELMVRVCLIIHFCSQYNVFGSIIFARPEFCSGNEGSNYTVCVFLCKSYCSFKRDKTLNRQEPTYVILRLFSCVKWTVFYIISLSSVNP